MVSANWGGWDIIVCYYIQSKINDELLRSEKRL